VFLPLQQGFPGLVFPIFLMINSYKRIAFNYKKPNSKVLGSFSQHFLFFVAFEWDQLARVLDYTSQERIVMDKHSILLGLFVSYKKVL